MHSFNEHLSPGYTSYAVLALGYPGELAGIHFLNELTALPANRPVLTTATNQSPPTLPFTAKALTYTYIAANFSSFKILFHCSPSSPSLVFIPLPTVGQGREIQPLQMVCRVPSSPIVDDFFSVFSRMGNLGERRTHQCRKQCLVTVG